MSTPKTGPLGGFGDLVLGGNPERGDLAGSLRGVSKHYRFHESSAAVNASDEFGGLALTGGGLDGQVPVFGGEGANYTCVGLPSKPANPDQGSTAKLTDAAPTGHWQTFWADEGSVEFWFQLERVPSSDSYASAYMLLAVGDPSSTDEPGLLLSLGSVVQSGQPTQWWLGGRGVGFGDLSDLQWHHHRLTWSRSKNFVRAYFDYALHLDTYFAMSPSPPSSAAKLYVGGTDFPDFFSDKSGGRYGIAGSIEDLTFSNLATDQGTFNPVYVGATTGIGISPSSLVRRPIRITQVYGEGLLADQSNAFLSNLAFEVVRTGANAGRATSIYAEVLRSLPVETFNVSASTSFSLSSSSAGSHTRVLNVSAATGLGVGSTDTSRVGVPRTVSAASVVNFAATSVGYVPAAYALSARSDMTVAGSGTAVVHNPQPYFVSASSNATFSTSARIGLTRVLQLAATTGLVVSSSSYAPTTFRLTASSGLFVSSHGAARSTAILVAAETSFGLTQRSPNPYVFGPKFVSASTGLIFETTADLTANLLLNVSALTSMALDDLAGALKSGPILVSAASNFKLIQKVAYTNPGPRYVSAATNLSLATAATYSRSAILMVSALSGITLAPAASEVASLNVSALGGFVVAGAGRQSRGIAAVAATSLGLGNAPRTSNLKPLDARSTMTFVASAVSLITGTEAGSGLAFTDLAQAVVWIPWRRAGLTLPPGGNLPHS